MAHQEFLDGGYRGKLGMTVGMRYHEGYTVRSWVKPNDPNSPAQQSHREMFALAAQLSVEARRINGDDGEWDTSRICEYSARLKQAYAHLRAGETPEQAFPLHPDGWTEPIITLLADSTVNAIEQTALFNFSQMVDVGETWLELSFVGKDTFGNDTVSQSFARFQLSKTPAFSFLKTFTDIDFADTTEIQFFATAHLSETGEFDVIASDTVTGEYIPIPAPQFIISSGRVEVDNSIMQVILSAFSGYSGRYLEWSFFTKNASGATVVTKTWARQLVIGSESLTVTKPFSGIDFADSTSVEIIGKLWDGNSGAAKLIASDSIAGTFVPTSLPILVYSSAAVVATTRKFVVILSKLANCLNLWLKFEFLAYDKNGDEIFSWNWDRTKITNTSLLSYTKDFTSSMQLAVKSVMIRTSIWTDEEGDICVGSFVAPAPIYRALQASDFSIAKNGTQTATTFIKATVIGVLGAVGRYGYFVGTVDNASGSEVTELTQVMYQIPANPHNRQTYFESVAPTWAIARGTFWVTDEEGENEDSLEIPFTITRN